jgi:YebC/PmpR family DNA-binding regulatory protein
MAGHSKWANTRHKKARNDSIRQKLWDKLAKEITVAAKIGGEDTDLNPRLRASIAKAKSNSLPSKNIESAIAKGVGGHSNQNLEELVYEGYGPGGTAFLVIALTDNGTRTVADVRNIFSKFGGNMGDSGAVSWKFTNCGYFLIESILISENKLLELILEEGADNLKNLGESFEITCPLEYFVGILQTLEKNNIHTLKAEILYLPKTLVDINSESAQTIVKIIERFDENDDIQEVYHNADFSKLPSLQL